jgi:predicted class III extradiol MEMO1 family dioxygenase
LNVVAYVIVAPHAKCTYSGPKILWGIMTTISPKDMAMLKHLMGILFSPDHYYIIHADFGVQPIELGTTLVSFPTTFLNSDSHYLMMTN